jgi:hypothetical protein
MKADVYQAGEASCLNIRLRPRYVIALILSRRVLLLVGRKYDGQCIETDSINQIVHSGNRLGNSIRISYGALLAVSNHMPGPYNNCCSDQQLCILCIASFL